MTGVHPLHNTGSRNNSSLGQSGAIMQIEDELIGDRSCIPESRACSLCEWDNLSWSNDSWLRCNTRKTNSYNPAVQVLYVPELSEWEWSSRNRLPYPADHNYYFKRGTRSLRYCISCRTRSCLLESILGD